MSVLSILEFPDPRLRKRFLELECRNGEAEIEALHFAAAVLLEEIELRLRLHAFRHDPQVESLSELDH